MSETKNTKSFNLQWLKLATTIAEGVGAEQIPFAEEKNMFGRTVHYSSLGDTAFALGLAITGIRVSVLCMERNFFKNINTLKQASRQHIPLVILLTGKAKPLSTLSGINVFRLNAANGQEALDFMIIAHRVSELSLIPGVVIFTDSNDSETFSIPAENLLAAFLGEGDDRINSCSASQQIIFGKNRRRIPNWFNPDIPVFTNVSKDERGLMFESAANEVFFNAHFNEIADKALLEFATLTGRKYQPKFEQYASKSNDFDNIPFVVENSRFPKHQVLLQTISREYPALKSKSIRTLNDIGLNTQTTIPLSLRKYKDHGPSYSRLSRFYDDTALFYDHVNSELVADPFQAIPIMPPATADFGLNVGNRKNVPVFEPHHCTGCGNCLVECPHSALPSLALNLEDILKKGVQLARNQGHIIAQIVPLQKGWVKAACNEINERKSEISQLKDFLPQAFKVLTSQMQMDGEKLEIVSKEMASIVETIGEFPIAVTDKFFSERNIIENGSGELFSLAVNLNACTGCGLCAEVCDEKAIVMNLPTMAVEENLHRSFNLLEQLPDTSGNTIARMIDDHNYSSLAAISLSRNYYHSLSGGSSNEHASSLKTLLHNVLNTLEFIVQPKYLRLKKIIAEDIESLSGNIKKELADSFPSGNLSELTGAIEKTSGVKINIDDILKKWSNKEHLKSIEKSALQRKIDMVKSLTDLSNLISAGISGIGRSRYAIVLDSSLAEMGAYPWNNFTSPVTLFDGSSPELAMGILEGQIRNILDNLKLIRKAKLEIQNKYNPVLHDAQIAGLSWRDLTEDEKGMVPPVLVISKRSCFRENGNSAFVDLLNSTLPVKLIIIDDCLPPIGRSASFIAEPANEIFAAMSSGNAFVLKGSLAAPEHLFSGLCMAFDCTSPAMLWLFAPNHERHHLLRKDWTKLDLIARNTRAFTHFDFNPKREGKLFSSKVEINANPNHLNDWSIIEIEYKQDNQKQKMNYAVTWADWAFTISEWESGFSSYFEQSGTAIMVSDFIRLDKNSRTGKVPVIVRVNDALELVMYMVSDEIMEATEATLRSWNMLREFAGALTEFPARLYQSVEKSLSVKYEDDMQKLVKDYEERIAKLEEDHLKKIQLKLRERLMILSNRGADGL
jgi:Pyruvate/2-oxoacid:ferredoxin oxidoreductase delta subunit